MKNIAIIPPRSGSKGVKDKNCNYTRLLAVKTAYFSEEVCAA